MSAAGELAAYGRELERELARNLTRALCKSIGGGFHPDTAAREYTFAEIVEPDTLDAIDAALDFAHRALGDEIYEVALDELNKLHDLD